MSAINHEDRRIAVHKLIMASHCLHSALLTRDDERRAEANRTQTRGQSTALGRVLHMLMDGKGPEQIVSQLCEREPDVSIQDVMDAIARATKMAARARSRMSNGRDVRRERLVLWTEPETGWTICAQPDRVEVFSDEQGEFIQITEYKLDPFVRQRHKEAVRLFGLVLFMLLKRPDVRVKLVVECLDEAKTWSEWMGPLSQIVETLSGVQALLRRLTEAQAADRVAPRNAGQHCFGCALRESCRQGRKFIARVQRTPAAAAA